MEAEIETLGNIRTVLEHLEQTYWKSWFPVGIVLKDKEVPLFTGKLTEETMASFRNDAYYLESGHHSLFSEANAFLCFSIRYDKFAMGASQDWKEQGERCMTTAELLAYTRIKKGEEMKDQKMIITVVRKTDDKHTRTDLLRLTGEYVLGARGLLLRAELRTS